MNRGAMSAGANAHATPPLDNTVAIETPEHIRFRQYVGGPTRRFFAYLLDWLARLVLAALVDMPTLPHH